MGRTQCKALGRAQMVGAELITDSMAVAAERGKRNDVATERGYLNIWEVVR
jgi:hypothetical protein